MESLPIDEQISSLLVALKASSQLIVMAPPGTGKTTRVPVAVQNSLGGEVLVLQPRRLAAKLSAERVSHELGTQVGDFVGYQFRFENKSSVNTRIRFLTEGTFTRRLLKDRKLTGVSAVILDEFHERHIHTDLALSVLKALQGCERPDIKIIVMSATLKIDMLSVFLSSAAVIKVPTTLYPLEIHYEKNPRHWLKDLTVLISRLQGHRESVRSRSDILVFLPGRREIESAQKALREFKEFKVLGFYASAPRSEQIEALTPEGPRKIVLATNIAETSLTIPGVNIVIDSGVAKVPQFSWWSGLPQLKIQSVSKASATQRAGRAARTGPGTCYRLYSKQDFDKRAEFDTPEIHRSELSTLILELASMSLKDFSWFQEPPLENLQAAQKLLTLIGAIENQRITEHGRRLIALPLHPRLANLVLYANKNGQGHWGAVAAAALSLDHLSSEDILSELHKIKFSRDPTFSNTLQQIKNSIKLTSSKEPDDGILAQAFLRAFPDRVAKLVHHGTLSLCLGGSVELKDPGLLASSEYFVLPEVEEIASGKGRKRVARSAVGILPTWLIEMDSFIQEENLLNWNPHNARVEEVSRIKYANLTLSEGTSEIIETPKNREDACEILLQEFLQKHKDNWIRQLQRGLEVESLTLRSAYLAQLSESQDLNLKDIIRKQIKESSLRFSFEEIENLDIIGILQSTDWYQKVEAELPESLQIRGRKIKIHYSTHQPPWVEGRIQDFFGVKKTPQILGRPLTLHLLAPNHRAVQVTQDLEGFWQRHYPKLRVELGRRYPRHKWPADPLSVI